MLGLFKNFFEKRRLAELREAVARVNALEVEVSAYDDARLRKESDTLREAAKNGGALDELLPRAFALVREAAKRNLKQRPFDVQLMGGMVLHKGGIAEMMTGEGKTLAAVAPAYLNALPGNGVHIVTVNEYLARRDAVWMGQIYRALGLSVACLVPNAAFLYDPEWKIPPEAQKKADEARDATGSFIIQQEFLRPASRREAYLADVAYGTNHEFGFDYLRDNLAYNRFDQVQRGHPYAIIDEVDSILIDEARTPLIIAAPDTESSAFYKTFARVAANLAPETDYAADEKRRAVSITEEGINKVEKMVGVKNLYAPENLRLVHYLEESLKARALFRKDKEYVVKNGEVLIVDEFTGRLLHGRRYSGGLHQAIEAKEGVAVKEESKTYAKVSIQNYFRLYRKLAGMTGTAQTSAEEFFKVYEMEVASIPPNRPLGRKDLPDLIYKTADAKWRAVAEEVKRRYEAGQPVLLGTTSIAKNERLSGTLVSYGLPHEVLNAKNNEREGAIIAQAGRAKAVTVATNMAGRGVDIILGGNPPSPDEARAVRERGGLHVIGTERHEARRIDNQLRGRAGRQGDPGSSQFFLSLEDDLVRIFGGDRIKSLMDRLRIPDDQPIEARMVSRAVAQAQSKVEGANFDLRKHLLEYDDVLNKQRASVYRRRQEILESPAKEGVSGLVHEAASAHLEKMFPAGAEGGALPEEAAAELKKAFEAAGVLKGESWPGKLSLKNLHDLLSKRSVEAGADPMTLSRMLGILDLLWLNHLEDLEALSESIGLRAYGQRDPLVEYRQEAHRLFKDFWNNFNAWVFANIFRLAQAAVVSGGAAPAAAPAAPAVKIPAAQSASTPNSKVGRNDPCPCGSGKKYKKCHSR